MSNKYHETQSSKFIDKYFFSVSKKVNDIKEAMKQIFFLQQFKNLSIK